MALTDSSTEVRLPEGQPEAPPVRMEPTPQTSSFGGLRELASGSEQRLEGLQTLRPPASPRLASPTFSRHTQTDAVRAPPQLPPPAPPPWRTATWEEWPQSEPERTSWGERRLPIELVGPPSGYTDRRARVAYVLSWIRFQRWASLPFDRLILKLEGMGIQLGMEEQDLLRHLMAFPGDISRVWPG
ncbi:unnamed protein product [Symbiodinium pilosum]|uniref:Uncharacterized protein n=1 Tax=Symbiodinium pilosum TaxID=2952 RepID=A0A812WEG6_SYMPI|nr:unnamed protein product [Symbiodinium pilosum]